MLEQAWSRLRRAARGLEARPRWDARSPRGCSAAILRPARPGTDGARHADRPGRPVVPGRARSRYPTCGTEDSSSSSAAWSRRSRRTAVRRDHPVANCEPTGRWAPWHSPLGRWLAPALLDGDVQTRSRPRTTSSAGPMALLVFGVPGARRGGCWQFSFRKQLRKAQAAREEGVYGDPPAPPEASSRGTKPPTFVTLSCSLAALLIGVLRQQRPQPARACLRPEPSRSDVTLAAVAAIACCTLPRPWVRDSWRDADAGANLDGVLVGAEVRNCHWSSASASR